MTKLKEKSNSQFIDSNKSKILNQKFEFIYEWLPTKYAREVYNLLPDDKKVELSYIRTVKKEKINNSLIIEALYKVAQTRKIQIEELNNL